MKKSHERAWQNLQKLTVPSLTPRYSAALLDASLKTIQILQAVTWSLTYHLTSSFPKRQMIKFTSLGERVSAVEISSEHFTELLTGK